MEVRDFLYKHPRIKILLFLLAVVIASPFAMELLIFLQFGGIEVAFLCMLATFKPYFNKLRDFVQSVKGCLKLVKSILASHQITSAKSITFNASFSLATIFFTGSFTFCLAGWIISLALLN